jgi:hypothetical protein
MSLVSLEMCQFNNILVFFLLCEWFSDTITMVISCKNLSFSGSEKMTLLFDSTCSYLVLFWKQLLLYLYILKTKRIVASILTYKSSINLQKITYVKTFQFEQLKSVVRHWVWKRPRQSPVWQVRVVRNFHSPNQTTSRDQRRKNQWVRRVSRFLFSLAKPEFYSHLASWRVLNHTPLCDTWTVSFCYGNFCT